MLILEKFKGKSPRYPANYEYTIMERFSRKYGGTEKEKVEQGKFFSNYYECYIYALMLGIRNDYSIPISSNRSKESKSFIRFGDWKPETLQTYIFMTLLAVSDIELIDLEKLNDKETENKATELLHLMESYANGGFDIINSKMETSPTFFDTEFSMVNFLSMTK